MSEFGDKFEENMPGLLATHGDSVTVTLADNSTLTRTAIFNRDSFAIDHTQDGRFHFRDDATTGLTAAQAKRCTKVTFNGTTWTNVDSRRDEDGGWELICKGVDLIT